MQAVLHNKRLKTIDRRHPWVFSRAIRRFTGNPKAGDLVTLISEDDRFLARGLWNPKSAIRLRVLTWDDEPIDDAFWARRLRKAIDRRQLNPNTAKRLIHAENDYLPGLIVDQYGDFLVLQALAVGIDERKHQIASLLDELLQPEGIYERSDSDARQREGLEPSVGVLRGKAPPQKIKITENLDHQFWVNVYNGHKTGFYLDQAENRLLLADVMSEGARVLNTFAYTGGFSVYAYAAGAEAVYSVDSSESALNLAEENLALNGFDDTPLLAGDVFDVMRDYRELGETFDVIILDPPKFASSQKQVNMALRGYKDINLMAFQLLNPGGLLMTYSCSGNVSADLFRKVVFGALEDSGREAQILRQLHAPSDHPIALTFPEGEYLKGLLCQVD